MKSSVMLPASIACLALLIAFHGAVSKLRGVAVLRQSSWIWVFVGLSTALLGYAAREADLDDTICVPNSWFQWHSVWHLLMAVAYISVYLFFRSDLVQGKDKTIAGGTTVVPSSSIAIDVLPTKNAGGKGNVEKAPKDDAHSVSMGTATATTTRGESL
jgi:hypothetical protein